MLRRLGTRLSCLAHAPLAIASLAIAVHATTASAGDGRIEINQARAEAGGVSPSDTPGFPVTLAAGRSYVLTGSLAVPPGTGAIVTESGDLGLVLDLNGFTVQGPVTCSLGTCSATGSADGIVVNSSNATVRNGTVRGFEDDGVRFGALGARGEVSDLVVEQNAGTGVESPVAGLVARRVRSVGNGGNGVWLGQYGRLEDSLIQGNGATGLVCAGDTRVENNVLVSSGTALDLSGSTAYRNNTIDGAIAPTPGQDLGGNVCNGAAAFCP